MRSSGTDTTARIARAVRTMPNGRAGSRTAPSGRPWSAKDASSEPSRASVHVATQASGHACRLLEFTLPDDEHRVAETFERVDCPMVAQPVRVEFGEPESAIAFGDGRALAPRMGVPVAPVHEDGPASTTVREIGRARQIPVTDSVSGTESVNDATDGQLRTRVLLADSSHAQRSFGVDDEIVRSSRAAHATPREVGRAHRCSSRARRRVARAHGAYCVRVARKNRSLLCARAALRD